MVERMCWLMSSVANNAIVLPVGLFRASKSNPLPSVAPAPTPPLHLPLPLPVPTVTLLPGCLCPQRRRRLQKAVTELRGQRRGTYSGSGDWQPRAPGASLLELGDCHEEVRRDDTTRDHSPPNPLKLHLEIDGASKAASPSKGQAPPPTPSQWMKQTESKLKSLGRQWSGKGMDESIRPLVGSYEFGCTRASKAAAVHDGDKELLAGRCNEDLVIGIDDGPSLEGTVVAVVAKGAPPPTPMNKGKEIDLLP